MAKNTRNLNIVVAVRDQTKKTLDGVRGRIRKTAKNMYADWQILWHAKVKESLKRLQRRVSQFANRAGQLLKRAFQAAAVAVTLAFGLMVRGVKKQFEEIDQLAKDAFRFGVAIESIRGLELAASLSGLSLSELGTILRDTARRVSEAAQGTGEAQDALKELGLDAKQLNLMPVEDQLDLILAAMGKVENKNDRIRLSYDIMGRSGVKGLTLIGTSLRESIQETEMLGTALNDEIAANVQKANDDLTRMKEAFKGIVQVVVADLAPKLTVLFKGIKQFLIEVRLGIQAIPLTVEAELLKVRKTITDFEKFLLNNKAGRLLLGEETISNLNFLSKDDKKRIKEIEGLLNNLTRQAGQLAGPGERFAEMPGEGEERTRPAPAGMPGLTGGRLLTGAAQSSAERLAALQKESDAKRAREAAVAQKQREMSNKLLSDLLRGAVRGPSNLGTLLQ